MAEERDEYLSRKTGRLRKRRSDGWTRRDIATFIDHYRITGDQSAAAAAAGKSARAAGNLRAVDVAFAAQMDAAEEEFERSLEARVALFAQTGGKLPPRREDGEPAEAPLENFDPQVALAYLSFRRAKKEARGRRGGPRPRSVSKDELVETFVKLMGMMKRRRAARPAA
ncbi:MAG TPA: hypothetical protein VEC11_10120 [Allosphingosinicella sp.]|nr:hypothetical protein [Allosphingosinicella sp.]